MKGLSVVKGRIVQVLFEDHSVDARGEKTDEIMLFLVWGRLEKITTKYLSVVTWELQNGNEETKRFNKEVAKILRSTVKDVRFLEVPDEIKIP